MPLPTQNFLLALLAEFRWACAAAQRYEDLKYRSAWRGSVAPADIPRRIFEEFYSVGEAVEVAPPRVLWSRSAISSGSPSCVAGSGRSPRGSPSSW
jgi:hypothetical protein